MSMSMVQWFDSMEFVADLHLHSKYSRAVSPSMTLPVMEQYAIQKGIDILSACDWTHPLWFKEMRQQLEEEAEGVYSLKSEYRNSKSEIASNATGANSNVQKLVRFILSTEISSIYSQGGKLRRIHNLVFAPSFETAEKVSKELVRRGCNLMADGRPIIGLSSKNLLELILSIDERCLLVPCHVWTPHFGIYGSASGFDSLDEAFGDLAKNIYGVETGLSSDPEMNWQIEELEKRSILSFSDAHSPAKMGREATVFELEKPTFENVRKAIAKPARSVIANEVKQSQEKGIASSPSTDSQDPRNDNRIIYTIEFYPEEGKYHYSGHRNCKVAFGPEEIRKQGSICPACKKRLTEGVLFRLQQLSNKENPMVNKQNSHELKWYIDSSKNHPPYVKLVPLLEIVAESLSSTTSSMKVKQLFDKLCFSLESEINVLLHAPIEKVAIVGGEKVAEGVSKVRLGDIAIDPGFDGEYGKVKIWREEGRKEESIHEIPQLALKF